jgi:hypothetical protein
MRFGKLLLFVLVLLRTEQQWNWTERYADHAEIRRYLEHVTERFDLLRDIELDTRVVGARFHEDARRWSVETERGERFTAQFVVTAVGCLSSANIPNKSESHNFTRELPAWRAYCGARRLQLRKHKFGIGGSVGAPSGGIAGNAHLLKSIYRIGAVMT